MPVGPITTRLPCLKIWYDRSQTQRLGVSSIANAIRPSRTLKGRQGHHLTAASAAAPPASQEAGWSLYDHPELYDAAFSFRNFDQEVEFLEKVCEDHTGQAPTSFLELGCGPANHAIRLAQKGHTVFALDLSKLELAYAKQKAETAAASVEFLLEDMRDYNLPERARVDAAFILLGTLCHLQTTEDVQSCWQATQRALKPGGLLVIEVQHPQDVFESAFVQGVMWEAPLGDEQEVVMEFGTDDDFFDIETQVLRKRVGVSVRKEEAVDLQGEGYVLQRIFTLQELRLLADSVGFEVVGIYGGFDLGIDLSHDDASCMVLCLQKSFREEDTDTLK